MTLGGQLEDKILVLALVLTYCLIQKQSLNLPGLKFLKGKLIKLLGHEIDKAFFQMITWRFYNNKEFI